MKLFRAGVSTVVLAACAAATVSTRAQTTVPGDPLTGTGNVSRTLLTYSNLMSTTQLKSMVNDSAFAVPANAAPPIDTFQGTLTLAAGSTSNATYTVYYEYSPDVNYYSGYQHYLPPFSFQYVQNGSYLIPVKPGFNITGNPYWNISLGTGRAWTEASDNGYTRASMPFSLVEYNQNCMHHGEMTFLFSNTKSPAISNVEYQIDMDSCAYWMFDMTGNIGATYTPATISNALALQNAEATEIANRIPVKPISALATDYPNSGFTPSNITGEYSYPGDIETYGVYFNGINYVGGCNTRALGSAALNNASVYAFCGEMRFPSYSVAKTAFANMALMKLGHDYGNSVYSSLIKSYIPSTYVGEGGNWTNVTFDETSDMATGNYNSTGYEVDEDSNTMTADVLDAVPYTTKIGNSFKYFAAETTPETTWVYHTSDSFILTAAMQYLLQGQTTSSNDLSTYLNTNIFIPLNLSAASMNVLRTDNASSSTTATGFPIGGYGMFINQDDIVKISNYMNAGTGQINGAQVIDATRLQDTLFRSSQSGLVIPDSAFYGTSTPPVANTNHYNNEIWEKTFTPTEYSNFSCSFNVPYMSGYGGNTIELFPNGAVFYIFSDGDEFYEDDPAIEVNKLAPMCPASPATVSTAQISYASTSMTPITQTYTITNPNAYTISLSVPTITGTNASLFSVGSYCLQLAANVSCTMSITFTPTATGNFSATLTVPTSVSYTIGTTSTPNSSATIALIGYIGPTRTTPTIVWNTPTAIPYGTALSGTQLNASSPTAGTFMYSPAIGTILAPGMQTLSTTFTPGNLSIYSPVTQTVVLQVNQVPTSVSWTPSTLSIYAGTALGSSIINATSTTAGSIAYTAVQNGGSPLSITAATVLPAGTYTLTATLTPSNAVDYASSSDSQILVVTTQNIWVVNSNGSISELNAGGTSLTSTAISGGGVSAAVDSAGSIWSLNASANSVTKLSNQGVLQISDAGGAGIFSPTALAIDGDGQVWIANSNSSISELSNIGVAISPSTGYTDSTILGATGIAIDISGNVWIANGASNSVDEVLGAAVPVAPLAVAVQNNTVGVKP